MSESTLHQGVSGTAAFAKNKPAREQGEGDRDPQITHTAASCFFLLAESTIASCSFFFFSFLKEIKCKRYVSTALKLRFRHVFQCYDSHSNCNSTSLHILLQGIKINIALYTAEYITQHSEILEQFENSIRLCLLQALE